MESRRTLRFSLRQLFWLITALVLVAGFPLYRRSMIRTICTELHAEGHAFSVPDEWQDYLWQRAPIVGTLAYENRAEVIETWAMHPVRKRMQTKIIDDKETVARLKKLGMVKYD